MTCSVSYVRDLIRKVTNRLKPTTGGTWQQIDPNKSVEHYAPDAETQKVIQAFVKLIMLREGCKMCPWPGNWPKLKISDLAAKLLSC